MHVVKIVIISCCDHSVNIYHTYQNMVCIYLSSIIIHYPNIKLNFWDFTKYINTIRPNYSLNSFPTLLMLLPGVGKELFIGLRKKHYHSYTIMHRVSPISWFQILTFHIWHLFKDISTVNRGINHQFWEFKPHHTWHVCSPYHLLTATCKHFSIPIVVIPVFGHHEWVSPLVSVLVNVNGRIQDALINTQNQPR